VGEQERRKGNGRGCVAGWRVEGRGWRSEGNSGSWAQSQASKHGSALSEYANYEEAYCSWAAVSLQAEGRAG